MGATLLVSEQFIKDQTQLSKNVDPNYIFEAALWAQDSEIQFVLGSTLYAKLKADVDAGTLAGDYKTLVDNYIQICMKHYVLAGTLHMAHYKITNKGVQVQDSENSQPTSRSMVDFLVEQETQKAEFYRQRMIDYLCENSILFPEYQNPGAGVDVIIPSNDNYTTSFYLGGSHPKRDYYA